MAYCKYCGRHLEENEKCFCIESERVQMVNTKNESMIYRESKDVSEYDTVSSIKNNTRSLINVFFDGLHDLLETMCRLFDENNKSGVGIFFIHLLIMFATFTINFPLTGGFVEKDLLVKIVSFVVLIIGLSVLEFAVGVFIIGKILKIEFSFGQAFSVIGIATIPGSVLLFIALWAGYVSTGLWVCIMLIIYLSWLIISTEAIDVIFDCNYNKVFYTSIILHIVGIVSSIILIREIILGELGNMVSNIVGLFSSSLL